MNRVVYKLVMPCILAVSGSPGYAYGRANVILNGYSGANYVSLNKNIGHYLCVTGKLAVNTSGVYFALQPVEKDGLIDPGFSRVITDLSNTTTKGLTLFTESRHTVCGTLKSNSRFARCTINECKWYKLTNSRFRR